MGIKSDGWIRRMAKEHNMISPFEAHQVREAEQGRVISYGTSSYGYDVRCSDEFKVFTNINSAVVDPKNFDENSFVDVKSDVYNSLPKGQWQWQQRPRQPQRQLQRQHAWHR